MNKVNYEQTIKNIIKENIKDDKMLNGMVAAFAEKGLNMNIPTMLFNDEIINSKLSTNELICLGNYLFLKGYTTLKPENNFSNLELESYEQYVVIDDENKINTIQLKEFRKINDTVYVGYLTPKYLLQLRNNKLVAYYKGLQRKSTVTKTKNGNIIEKATINKKNVKDLKERFLKKDIIPTEITFSILAAPGKDINFREEHIEGTKNIYNLYIKPEFNRDSVNYTPFIIPDGFHRFTGLCNAEETENLPDDDGLIVKILIKNEEDTKRFIQDGFKRTGTDEDFLENLVNNTNEDKIADKIISSSKILNGKVGDNINDCKTKDLTFKKVIINTIKNIDINKNNMLSAIITAEEIAKTLDMMINYISDITRQDFNSMKNTDLLRPFSFTGYIYLANEINKNGGELEQIKYTCDNIIQMNILNKFSNLNLNKSNCNINNVINKFEECM